jgi:hypothetical protein
MTLYPALLRFDTVLAGSLTGYGATPAESVALNFNSQIFIIERLELNLVDP